MLARRGIVKGAFRRHRGASHNGARFNRAQSPSSDTRAPVCYHKSHGAVLPEKEHHRGKAHGGALHRGALKGAPRNKGTTRGARRRAPSSQRRSTKGERRTGCTARGSVFSGSNTNTLSWVLRCAPHPPFQHPHPHFHNALYHQHFMWLPCFCFPAC